LRKTVTESPLSIRDSGTGFSFEQKSGGIGKGGSGLTEIRERASLLGEIVDIQSQ
jgi:signal transduction histidine kinase